VEFSQLHFAHPLWLLAGLVIPIVWVVYFLFYRISRPIHQLEKFIDSHLLPYLLVNNSNKGGSSWKHLLLWTAVWSFLTLGLAGPRWDFREIETFSRDQSLVILLDLSESMNATDVKPSRLVRAKQKIEDLINLSKGVKIGLIAFAADPHMITPLTEDTETIRHLLPSLDTSLVYVQGSRLSSALDMASVMLEPEPGNNKALLVISDGSFEDATAIITAKKLAEKGIVLHTMGVGTENGAPIKDHQGNVVKKNGVPILSKLEKERFSEISKIGNGQYLEAQHSDQAESLILKDLEKRAEAQVALGKKSRLWDERFFLMIFPALPIILWWFRRGAVFALALILFIPSFDLQADAADYFKNTEQLGKQSLEEGDYETAIRKFQDPYRKGVAYYRAGNFAEAENMFRQSSRTDVASSAEYNLGNSLVRQQKFEEAKTAYEELLKKWPEHTKAKENLELVKKMLEQQKQESSNSENSGQQENENKEDQGKKDQSNSGSKKENKGENQDSKGKCDPGKKEEGKDQASDSSGEQRTPHDQGKDGQQNEGLEPQSMEEKEKARDGQNEIPDGWQNQQKGIEEADAAQKEGKGAKASKTQEDLDADLWLNRITNDPKTFMKNKFYIESKKNGTTEGIDPW